MKVGVKPVVKSWDPTVLCELFLDRVPQSYHPEILRCIRSIQNGQSELGVRGLKALVRPEFSASSEEYASVAQLAAFVTKLPEMGSVKRRRQAALSVFRECELKCRRSNRRLRHYRKYPNRMPENIRIILSRAKENIFNVLGHLDESVYDRIIGMARFGKGQSASSQSTSEVTVCYKLTDRISSSRSALAYLDDILKRDRHRSSFISSVDWVAKTGRLDLVELEHCRITTVPKDCLIDRTIGIEPSLNIELQLGVHEWLSRRLLSRTGIDIHSQERNRELAREGSENWQEFDPWCTVDLSSASDLICSELVSWLLPSEWSSFLNDLRTRSALVEGQVVPLEKWSSMGNGYTFVLETLVFWALGMACDSLCAEDPTVIVYGDDICIRRRSYALLVETFTFCGLKVNTSKSYAFGPFRESCGKDWYAGDSVRPVFVRSSKPNVLELNALVNQMSRVGHDPITRFLLSRYTTGTLFFVPHGTGGESFGVYSSDPDTSSRKWDKNLQCWKYRGWVNRPREYGYHERVRLSAWLQFPSKDGLKVTRRGKGTILSSFVPSPN